MMLISFWIWENYQVLKVWCVLGWACCLCQWTWSCRWWMKTLQCSPYAYCHLTSPPERCNQRKAIAKGWATAEATAGECYRKATAEECQVPTWHSSENIKGRRAIQDLNLSWDRTRYYSSENQIATAEAVGPQSNHQLMAGTQEVQETWPPFTNWKTVTCMQSYCGRQRVSPPKDQFVHEAEESGGLGHSEPGISVRPSMVGLIHRRMEWDDGITICRLGGTGGGIHRCIRLIGLIVGHWTWPFCSGSIALGRHAGENKVLQPRSFF